MSYQTGPSATPVALLDSFVTFLVAAGWVLDSNIAQLTGKRAHLHKGAKYIHLRSFINEQESHLGTGGTPGSGIAMTQGTGYNGANNWYIQAGVPLQFGATPGVDNWTAVMPLPAGAIQNYWMFADAAGDNVWLVAFKQAGVYTYLGFGELIKPTAWTGGSWFCGTRQSFNNDGIAAGPGVTTESHPPMSIRGFLRADVDSWVGNWNNLTNGVSSFGSATIGKRVQSTMYSVPGNNINIAGDHINYGSLAVRANTLRTGALILLPAILLIERDFGGALSGGGWSTCGQVPDVFQTTITGFVPGSQYTVSTDQYIVFPEFAIRKYP
jgi:hypothetical protein